MISAQQDVFRLDVAVDNAVLVSIGQRIGHFARDPEGIADWELVLPGEPAPQGLALDVRHAEPEQPAGIAGVVDAQYVWVLEASAEPDLAKEAIGSQCLRQFAGWRT